MSETVTGEAARDAQSMWQPGGRIFVALCGIVALIGLMPWMLAAAFAPALLGAPGPSQSPIVIIGIAAVLAYPIWLVYWARRTIAARRMGDTGKVTAVIMAVPAVMLLAVFSSMSFGP